MSTSQTHLPPISIEAMGREIVRLDAIHDRHDHASLDAREQLRSTACTDRLKAIAMEQIADHAGKWAFTRREALRELALHRPAETLTEVVVQALIGLEMLEQAAGSQEEADYAPIWRALISAAMLCSREAGIDYREFQYERHWIDRTVATHFPDLVASVEGDAK